jgi:hypothetical protein
MQFNSAPSNTLYIQVVLKKHPLSKQPISISITAAMYSTLTPSKALYFSELPLNSTTLAQIHATFARFVKQANAANFEVVKFNGNAASFVVAK